MVRVFIFLLSGLFCCLGFSGAFFLLFGRGRVLFFAVWAGAQALPKRPRPNSKKNTPPPLPDVFFCCLGGWVCLFFAVWAGGACSVFCCLGGGACSFFCCLGGGRVFFSAVWAKGRVFFSFAVWAGGRVLFFAVWAEACFFLLFGPGACFFLLFGRGTGVHSLTGLPGSSLSDPTTKKTNQQKKRGFQFLIAY